MDAWLQKLQESLVKGITPIARLMGTMGHVLEKEDTMSTLDDLWKDLSHSVLVMASATHPDHVQVRSL